MALNKRPTKDDRGYRLQVHCDETLRRQLKVLAAQRGESVQVYVLGLLRQAVAADPGPPGEPQDRP